MLIKVLDRSDDKNPIVNICALRAEDAPICPVRLLLSHALRLGNILGVKTYSDIVRVSSIGNSKALTWANPEWPLFCAMKARASALQPQHSASTHQLLATVKFAAELAGILPSVVCHDLRRGFFRDVAHMKTGD